MMGSMSQPWQPPHPPQPPRRSSGTAAWIVVGVIGLVVIGGLIALFALNPGGASDPEPDSPPPGTPGGARATPTPTPTPSPGTPDGPLLMPDEDYPATVGERELVFVGGLPAYDIVGSTLGTHRRISVSDSGLGQTLPIEDALKYEGREFEEMRPGMFCVTAGELHCRSESRFGRQWMAFSVDGDVPLEEVVAFFEEFLAGTGS